MTEKTLGLSLVQPIVRVPAKQHRQSVDRALTLCSSRIVPYVLPLALLALWQLATEAAFVSPLLLVPPAAVVHAFRELLTTGELAEHLKSSLGRLFIGFSLGASLGLFAGVAMGTSPRFAGYFQPFFQTARQLPTVALIPFFILVFGVEETFKVLLVTKACFFPVALAAVDATRGISRKYLEVAAIYQLPRATLIRCLVLPAVTPAVVAGMRISLGRAWMVLVAAELMAANAGVGQMMEMGRQMFRMDVVVVGVLVTGSIGLVLDVSVRLLERRLTSWRPRSL